MSVCYYESYNGKRPIVERVPECMPQCPTCDGNSGWFGGGYDPETGDGDPGQLCGTGCQGQYPMNLGHDDTAAALTRDAIKCWACQVTRAIIHTDRLLNAIDHENVNRLAHALADALEIP